MAKKATKKKPPATVAAKPPAKSLTTAERCQRAFATQARAAVEVEQLSKTEVTAFAELIDVDGEPLHLDVDGQTVRHCDRHDHGKALEVLASQRFARVFEKHLQRVIREAAEKRQQLNLQGKTGTQGSQGDGEAIVVADDAN